MVTTRTWISGLLLTTNLFLCTLSFADTSFSPQQKTEIGQTVREYLLTNPEVLVESMQVLKKKQLQTGIQSGATSLFAAPDSPFAGKKDNTLKLVEFFDYQCPVCRKMDTVIKDMLVKNGDLQVIFKIIPILGEVSEFAARAALASQKQNQFLAFHHAMLQEKENLSKEKILKIAADVKLNVDTLNKDMVSEEVTEQLRQNLALARTLGLPGTPSFIVGNYPLQGTQEFGFIAGGATQDVLQKLIDKARQGS